MAYLHLLNGVSAADAIAFARAETEAPGSTGPRGDGADEDPGAAPDIGAGNHPDDRDYDGPDDDGPDDAGDPGDDQGPSSDGGGPGGADAAPALPEFAVPLLTLQRQEGRPGDSRLLGPLDPAAARDLAAAAARSPGSQWEVIVVDGQGYAVGHGIARPARGQRQKPMPLSPVFGVLPARVTITVTETLLGLLRAHPAEPRSGAPPGDWGFVPRANGTWALLLPGGQELTVRFDVVPTHGCDHRFQVNSYVPGDRLRRLVQVRDRECTFPTCSRPARESDFEHAVPYHEGGRTDACNAGARSRRCHQVKQSPGWTVSQPRPGWHVWTTPTGRTYTQEPWRYIA
jgi:hypothetical protein